MPLADTVAAMWPSLVPGMRRIEVDSRARR
jgi:hypothetical protein